MHFSLFFTAGLGAGATQAVFTVAIVLLACLLGAEIAGICILLSKWKRAHHIKIDKHKYEAVDENDLNRLGGVGVMAAFAAVPTATYTALLVLAGLTAALAVVFLVLMLTFRARGYDFASLRTVREEEEAIDIATIQKNREDFLVLWPDSNAVEEEPKVEVVAEEIAPELTEEIDAVEPVLAEEDIQPVEVATEEAEPEQAIVALEPVESAETELAVVAEILPPVSAGATTTTTTTTTVEGGPTFADGTKPYKVVEKVVTETVTEVYKETPVEQPQPAASTNDAVLEKLVDLLDYEIRSRREAERAEQDEENKNSAKGASVATSASVIDEDADEDEDEDDIDDAKSDDEDDRDTEEDDTEGDHFTGNERIIGFNAETGHYIVAHYRKSFEAKLIQAQPKIKNYYSELKNALLSYKGTKNRISWTADSFHNGRTPIAKINVKTRILELYLALDPASLEGTVYRGKDVSAKKKYADTPFQYKLRTPRKFKWAMELIQRVCEEHGLTPIDIERVDYEAQYPFDTTENLVARKLIKEYIREEKPASTFELAPDHVPAVPEEDNTVLPPNDTFTWEFDNDRMVEREPEPVVEPTVEEEPAPEPIPEPAPEPTPAPAAPQTTVTRETVKVTEVRYTERYYADAEPAYQEIITTTEPIAVAAPDFEEMKAEAEATVQEATEDAQEILEESLYATDTDVLEATEEAETPEVDVWDEEPLEEYYDTEEVTEEYTEEYAEDATEAYAEEYAEDATEEYAEEYGEESVEEYTEESVEEYTEEEDEAVPAMAETNALPFRPSFYANRNYYADEPAEEVVDESEYAETDSYTEDAYEEAYEAGDEEAYEQAYEDGYTEEGYEEGYAEEEAYEGEETYAEDGYAEDAYEGGYEVTYEGEVYEDEDPADKVAPADPSVALIDLCAIEDAFADGDVVNLQTLKEKQLIIDAATTLKVYASGALSKRLTVEANQLTLDAIVAISNADGASMMVK